MKEELEVDRDHFSKFITGDEMWAPRLRHGNEVVIKAIQCHNDSPPPTKKRNNASQVKTNVERVLVHFIDAKGIVHIEIVLPS